MLKTLDPRTKIIIVLCISSNAVFINNVWILFGVLLLSIILAALVGNDITYILNRFKALFSIIIFMIIVQSIFCPSGEILISFKSFIILTTGGLSKGIEILFRILIIVFSATIISTSNYREIVQGLVQWKMPYEIAFMVLVGIRFLPLLTEEVKDVFTAIQLRGINFKKISFKNKIKVASFVFTPIVASTLIKAQKLSTAMETRAFRAYPTRTSYMKIDMSSIDYFVIIISLMLGIGGLSAYYILIK